MTYIDPPAKLLYHTDRINDIAAGKTPPPVNVEIDLSNRCGLGCRGCHFAYTHSRGPFANGPRPDGTVSTGDLMSTRLAMYITQQLQENGAHSITWTGGGEPLLHPDALEIFASHALEQGIYTNGTLIDPIKAAVLKRIMKWVYVSLDYSNRYDYLQNKQSDQFEKAIGGIRALVRASGSATVGVGFLLSRENWGKIGEMTGLALDTLGADYVQFRPMIQFDHANPGVLAEDTAWIKHCVTALKTLTDPRIIADVNRFEMYANWEGHPYPVCYWAQMQAVITPDGRVWTCVNRRGYWGNCLGDLNNESFGAIWERSGAYPVDSKCRLLCRGFIPNLSLNKMLGPKPEHWKFI